MNRPIEIRRYSSPPISEKEILRYAGCHSSDPQILSLIRDCLSEITSKLSYKVCFSEYPAAINENKCDLGFCSVLSDDLSKNLSGCHKIIVFAATIGLEMDRAIAKYARISPVKALLFQAIGAERIEALCDCFSEDIKSNVAAVGEYLHPRFSPGYGDLPLQFQKQIFMVLDCSRKIGIGLNESLLMSPSKSVTALIGLSHTPFGS